VEQDGFVDQIVDQQNGGSLNGFDGFESEQVRIARTCADQRAGA
jgi:hypothetical protein